MEDPAQTTTVRFHNVEFSIQGISLLDQQSKIVSVTKKDIRTITLKHGFQSERPLVEVVFGIALVFIGFYFIVNFILQILFNRIAYIDMVLSVLLLPVGIWFMVDGYKKRLYFEVTLDNDKRKFPLGKNPNKRELQKFIKMASQLGYPIDNSVLDKFP